MKKLIDASLWLKIMAPISVVTILLILIGINPVNVAAEKNSAYSDNYLYMKYQDNLINDRPIQAVMYLFAFKQRDPYILKSDAKYRAKVDKEIKNLIYYIERHQRDINTVNRDLGNCGCYPCRNCINKKDQKIGVNLFGLSALYSDLEIPPDTAMVCTDINFEGQCQLLSVGIYNNSTAIGLPNDSISSVMVGSNVKLILYLHGSLTGSSIYFSSSDTNLSDNWLIWGDKSYRWTDNATSLEIVRK